MAYWLNGKSWRDTVPEARGGGRHAHSQSGWWPGVIKWNGGLPKTGGHQGFNIQSFTEKDCSFSKFEMSGNHILSCNAVKIGINAEVEAGLLVGAGLPGWSFTGMTCWFLLIFHVSTGPIFKDRPLAPSNPSLGFLLPWNCFVGILVLFLLACLPPLECTLHEGRDLSFGLKTLSSKSRSLPGPQ